MESIQLITEQRTEVTLDGIAHSLDGMMQGIGIRVTRNGQRITNSYTRLKGAIAEESINKIE